MIFIRIDGLAGQQLIQKDTQITMPSKGEAIKNLSAGDLFHAQVLSVSSEGITLSLPDGTALAVSARSLDVKPGDVLELFVSQKGGGKISVELRNVLPGELHGDPAALLKAMNIEQNARNLAIAREFVRAGLTFDKQDVTQVARMLDSFRELTPGRAVFMVQNGIAANKTSVDMLTSFMENRNLLGDKLTALLGILGDSQLIAAGTTAAGDAGQAKLVQTGQASAKNPAAAGLGVLEAALSALDGAANPEATAQAQQPVAPGQPVPTADATAQTQQPVAPGQPVLTADATAQAQQPVSPGPMPTADATAQAQQPIALGPVPATDTTAQVQQPVAPGQPVPTADAAAQTQQTAQVAAQSQQAANALAQSGADRDIKTLLSSLFRRVGLDAAPLERGLRSEELGRELLRALEAVKQQAAQLPSAQREQAMQIVRNITETLNFTEQLTSFTKFVQIPVMINNQPATADMYVFKDPKKKKKLDPSNMTVLLSLRTANIGQIETLIKVIGKNVECDFSLMDERSLDLIKHNIAPLYEKVEGAGYKLVRVSFEPISRPSDFVTAHKRQRVRERRYSFDFRV